MHIRFRDLHEPHPARLLPLFRRLPHQRVQAVLRQVRPHRSRHSPRQRPPLRRQVRLRRVFPQRDNKRAERLGRVGDGDYCE